MENKVPWLPQELRQWEAARKVLGLLVGPKVKVDPNVYHLYHDEKVKDLLAKEERPDYVLNDLLPRKWEHLGEKKSPEELLELLKNDPAWRGPASYFQEYLRKQASLEDLKSILVLGDPEDPVSEKEFVQELRDLSLREYLELTI